MTSLQSNIAVNATNATISGNLAKITSGALPDRWGEGHFIALKFTKDSGVTKVRVGLHPTEGAGMQELDSDMDAVLKITDPATQKLVVEDSDGTRKSSQVYDLSGLILAE